MKFSEGDIVSKKTGGPLMTVEDDRIDGLVTCIWFDVDNRMQRDCFAPVTLNKWILATE